VGGEIRPCHLASEHLQPVAEHHDLDLLGTLGAKRQDNELKESAQSPVEQGNDDEVTRLRLHVYRRLRDLAEFADAEFSCEKTCGREDQSTFRHPHRPSQLPAETLIFAAQSYFSMCR
jgi:hypothetical protein